MQALKSNVVKSKVYAPNLPWNTFQPDDIGPAVMNFLMDQEAYYKRWSQRWYENFQFLFGNQNLKWSRRNDYAVDYDFLLTRVPAINQKVQTNLVRLITESLASYIYGNIPDWDVESMSDSSVKDKRFKVIVQKILDCYMERLSMATEFSIGSVMFALYGQMAWKIDWKPNAGTMLEIPRWQKSQKPLFTDYMAANPVTGGLLEVPTPYLGAAGQPMPQDVWEKAVDATGRAIMDKVMSGDLTVNALSPFQYRRPMGSPGMHKDKFIEEILIMDYDEYLDDYEAIPGKTKNWNQVRPVFHDQTLYAFAAKHFLRMQMTTPPVFNDTYRRAESVFRNSQFRQKVMVVEHYDKPHPIKWPMGRKLVITNGVCTHITTPTYHTNKQGGWHPYVEAQWMRVYPSSIASGPINDVVQKNRELNIKDSLVATSVRRNMGSVLLNKIGNGVDKDQLTGDPGQIVDCNDPFAMRWLHDDLPIPPIMEKLRQADKDDTYEVSGAGDAIRGERAEGTTSGYQARIQQDMEEKRLTPARINWEVAVSGVGEKLFSCLKTNVVQLPGDVMGFLMRSAAGQFSTNDVVALLSNPVDFGTDIKVKKSSMALKSKATMQATLQELSAQPAIAERLVNDAKVVDEYLKFFDVTTFRDRSAPHRDRAQKENEAFTDLLRLGQNAMGTIPPVVMFEDDDAIHMAEHADFLVQNADEIMANPQFMFEFLVHQETHRLQEMEKSAGIMPGAALQTGAMMGMAASQPVPTVQSLFMDARRRAQQAAAQGPGNPQAPKQPKQTPGGPSNKQTDTAAPADNTSAGRRGGMDQ